MYVNTLKLDFILERESWYCSENQIIPTLTERKKLLTRSIDIEKACDKMYNIHFTKLKEIGMKENVLLKEYLQKSIQYISCAFCA